MTDAVKMALEALADIRTSIECAAGCDEGIDPMAAVSEILLAYGTAMASAYSRAAEALAALEQAGEPVAKLHYSGDVMEAVQQLLERGRATLDSEGYLVTHPAEAPLPTLQRLGQEFDVGEYEPVAWLYNQLDRRFGGYTHVSVRKLTANETVGWTETPLYAHPPQSSIAAEPVGLREAMRQDRNEAIMALTAKFGPILKAAFLNEHSRTRFDVANALAEVALPTISQPDPQSRGQAFDSDGLRKAAQAVLDGMERPGSRAEYFIPEDGKEIWHDYHEVSDVMLNDLRAALSSAKRGEV